MVTDSSDIVLKLCNDIFLKLFCQIISCAGKHEIFPHDQSQFITNIPKEIRRIITSSPYPDTVKMSALCLYQKISGAFRCHSCQDIVFRNIIPTHGKNRNSVYLMGKRFSKCILFSSHRHGSKTDSLCICIDHLSILKELCLHLI